MDHVRLVATARVKINKEEKQTVMRRFNVTELTGDTALQYKVKKVNNKFQIVDLFKKKKYLICYGKRLETLWLM